MVKIAALSLADNELAKHLASRVKHSFNYFHPDIPFFIFTPNDEEKILGNKIPPATGLLSIVLRLRFIPYLLKQYDVIFFFDVDVVIASKLDEFLAVDYDLASSLNIARTSGDDYFNAGVFAVKSKEFMQEWFKLTYDFKSGFACQSAFNHLAHNGKYKVKVVDKENCYYNERSRPYWGNIVISENQLFCNKRHLKVLHWAGGSSALTSKLSCKRFNKETREFLNKVTGTTDFTDIEGVDKWY